jgi:hypothetical protein
MRNDVLNAPSNDRPSEIQRAQVRGEDSIDLAEK